MSNLGKFFVNLGNDKTYKDYIYAGGLTIDDNTKNEIKNLQIGQKISIIGIAFKPGSLVEGSWPMDLEDLKIVEE